IEMVRLAQRRNPDIQPQEVSRALQDLLVCHPPDVPFVAPNPIGEGNISIAPFRLGLQDETGRARSRCSPPRLDSAPQTAHRVDGIPTNLGALDSPPVVECPDCGAEPTGPFR